MKPFRDPEKVVRGLPLPTQEAFKHSNAALIDFICKGSCISFGLKKAKLEVLKYLDLRPSYWGRNGADVCVKGQRIQFNYILKDISP